MDLFSWAIVLMGCAVTLILLVGFLRELLQRKRP